MASEGDWGIRCDAQPKSHDETAAEAREDGERVTRARRAKVKAKRPRGRSSDPKLMARVVALRYAETDKDGNPRRLGYREIAEALHETVPCVIAAEENAFKQRLFDVVIHVPQEERDIACLERALLGWYPLTKVILVAGNPETLNDLGPFQLRGHHTEVTLKMAKRVTTYLDTLIAKRATESLRVAVAWGRTMRTIADHLNSSRREAPRGTVEFVGAVGLTGWKQALEANTNAVECARAYGGTAIQMPCPAFVPSYEADVIMQNEQVRSVLKMARESHVVVTSMGPIVQHDEDGKMKVAADFDMKQRLIEAARLDGAIGEICGWPWNAAGKPVTTSYRSIGIGFYGLRAIAADATREVILVCGGDKRRIEPLRVALRAGLVNVLVSDTVTARELIRVR